MTTLPIAHTWDDIQPGTEYATDPDHPLTGWRISVAVEDRNPAQPRAMRVFPFASIEYARNRHCNPFPTSDPEYRRNQDGNRLIADPKCRHTGEKVHPDCACGFHITRTQKMAAEFAERLAQPGHINLQRTIVKKSPVYCVGEVLCKVSTYYGAHATGPNQNPHLGDIDPPGTLRTNAMQLDAIYVPESLAQHSRLLFDHYDRFDVDVFTTSGSVTDELEEQQP